MNKDWYTNYIHIQLILSDIIYIYKIYVFCRRYNILDGTRHDTNLAEPYYWCTLYWLGLLLCLYQRKRNDLICQVRKTWRNTVGEKAVHVRLRYCHAPPALWFDLINNSVYYTRLESLEWLYTGKEDSFQTSLVVSLPDHFLPRPR